jgi:hypothetical protein
MTTSLLFGTPTAGRAHRCALGLIAIVCLSTSASSVVPAGDGTADDPALAGATPCGRPALELRLVDQTGEPDDSLAVARQEATAIWANAGLALVWHSQSIQALTDGPMVTIIVRRALVRRAESASGRGQGSGHPLGRALFVGLTPANVIEVSFSAVAALVSPETFAGKRVTDLPLDWRRRLLGRALGRVIAHEVGHWLWGVAHTRTGLMRPGLGGHALIALPAPALPRTSIGADAARRLGVDARCPAVPVPER